MNEAANEAAKDVLNNPNNETDNAPGEAGKDGQSQQLSPEKWAELLKAVHHNGLVALKSHYSHVEGQVLNMDVYGPVFVYRVQDTDGDSYACGFFLRELLSRFQSKNDPAVWMASFFVDLMKTKGGKLLPKPPANAEEAKAVVDKVLIPQLNAAVREEFAPEQVHVGLAMNEQHGPVFEAGFPSIKEGNNVCAIPVHLLLTHMQLNRDPSELLMQGLYNIRKEHGLDS